MKHTISTITHRILLAATVLTVTICSCKKEGNSGSSGSKTNVLTSGAWNLQKIETKSSDGTWGIPYYSDGPTDDNQITYTFFSNGTFALADDGDNVSGTWILSADQKSFTLSALQNGNSVSSTYAITILNSSTFQFLRADDDRETYGH